MTINNQKIYQHSIARLFRGNWYYGAEGCTKEKVSYPDFGVGIIVIVIITHVASLPIVCALTL